MPSSGMRAIVKQILKLQDTLSSVCQEEQMEVTYMIWRCLASLHQQL